MSEQATSTIEESRPMPKAPSKMERWFPIGSWLPGYKWGEYFTADLIAAISVAALLIPESMGYASVAGLPVEIGLYAAPLALIAYAMFGKSRLLVVATIGAVAAITGSLLSAINASNPPELAILMATALALTTGVIFLIAGLLRLGWVTNFLSRAVLEGFVLGMAIQIIVGQLDEMVGIHVVGESVFAKFGYWISHISEWDMTATAVGGGALLLIFALHKFAPKVPAAITAVALGSFLVYLFNPAIEIVEEIPRGMPSLANVAEVAFSDWLTLLLGGALVALISFAEGWGASADLSRRTHDRLNSNQEFIAYGVSNLGAGLLGGMPVGGSLSKSSAAVSAGAKTQMSNIILAGIVVLTLLFLAPIFQWLPEAVLAAVVIHAMWNSASPRKLRELWHIDQTDATLGIITAVLVLAFDLLPAMVAGIVLSIGYLIYRISFPARAELGREPQHGDFVAIHWLYGGHSGPAHPNAQRVENVLILRFGAPLIFANAEAFLQSGQDMLIAAAEQGSLPQVMVIDFEEILYIDTTGVDALENYHDYLTRYGVTLKLARVHSDAESLLQTAGLLDKIGKENIHHTVRSAVNSVGDKEIENGTGKRS